MDNVKKENITKIIFTLGAAIQRLSLYPPNHPTLKSAFLNPYAHLNQYLDKNGELNIGPAEKQLVVEGIPLDSNNLMVQNFISLLERNKIHSITILKGLQQKELIDFSNIIKEFDSEKNQIKDFERSLQEADIEHIKVNFISYTKVTKNQKEIIEGEREPLTERTKEAGRIEDLVIANYLMDKITESQFNRKEFENELVTNPQRIARIISLIADGKNEYQELKGNIPLSKVTIHCLQKITQYFLENTSLDWHSYRKNLVTLILSLNPESQRSLSIEQKTVMDGLSEEDLFKNLVLKFEDHVRIDIIVKEYLKHKNLSIEFIAFIKKIIPTQETLKEMMPLLIKKLRISGRSSEEIDSLQTTLWQKVATQARILIADDDDNMRNVYKEELEEVGFKVIEAESGKRALQKIFSQNPDLVVLDIKMPDMHGIEILEKMKMENTFIPTIICTSFEGMKEDFMVRTFPNLTYLVKPVLPKKLIAEIRKSLNR